MSDMNRVEKSGFGCELDLDDMQELLKTNGCTIANKHMALAGGFTDGEDVLLTPAAFESAVKWDDAARGESTVDVDESEPRRMEMLMRYAGTARQLRDLKAHGPARDFNYSRRNRRGEPGAAELRIVTAKDNATGRRYHIIMAQCEHWSMSPPDGN